MVTSSLSLLTWLAIAWGAVTSILIVLVIYRGMIGMHQEEQVFLTSASRGFEAESAEAAARSVKLQPYIRATALLSGLLAAAVIVVFVTDVIQHL